MNRVPWIDLKKLRREKDWTQEDAGAKLGFTRCYVSAVETGKRNISLKMMQKIIKVFNVKYEDFYNSE